MKVSKKSKATVGPSLPTNAAEIVEKLLPTLQGLSEEELKPCDGEVVPMLTTLQQVLQTYRSTYRDQIREELPKLDLQGVDSLEQLGTAVLLASHLAAPTAPESVPEQDKKVPSPSKLRDGLLLGAQALANRELIDPDLCNSIAERKGNDTLAQDLLDLAALFESNWSKITGRTAVEKSEVEQAKAFGTQLAVGELAKSIVEQISLDALKSRAFTLILRHYDTLKRAITYLRWSEGDADSIAPVLVKAKRERKKSEKTEEKTEETSESST